MKVSYFGCLTSLLLLTATGCGGGGGYAEGVTVGTVTGTLSAGGAALPEGCTLSFHPEGGTGVPAISVIDADGAFKLRARGSFDIPTGIYKVVVLPPAAPKMTDEQAMEASMAGTLPDNEVKAIPLSYRAADTTKESVEVKEGSNDFKIELKP